MKPASGLIFPQAPARPGEPPNFEGLDIPDAGMLGVPALDIEAEASHPYANGLIRVLDDDGRPAGPWADHIAEWDPALFHQGLHDMLTMRAVDRRLLNAQRQGKTCFYLQCTGEEAIGCAFQRQLAPGDMNFPTYRQQSLLIAADYPLRVFMGQIYSNDCDPIEGRQLPVMHSSRDHGFFSISGNLGTQYVQAVGWAMANALRGNGEIAAGWIGDGATASNDFHTALLCASLYRPPVILNIVNNQWAVSTHTGVSAGGSRTYAERARGYGIPALRVDGNDYLAVAAVSRWAVERTRGGFGPIAIEWFTYRVAAHSTSDDPSVYRPKDEAQAWPLGDPIERLKRYLIRQREWSEERHEQKAAEIHENVVTIQREVEARGTFLDPQPRSPARMLDGVYAELPDHLRRQRQEMGC